ncbi:PRAME family member 12-like [Perognathus longimembris pacificus]|uniref:PRAME family member 12-like n=1 Tax=Perognathus longimembris pacificus TaxID=214514 RepID=UPI002018A920|nr:PRAME family member 12-like [Perognathus longimembris pacificus]
MPRAREEQRVLEPAVSAVSAWLGWDSESPAHLINISSNKMSTRTPPSLQHLAIQSLLSNEALAISALEDVPHLFPLLLREVYTQSHTGVLKAMLQTWPFSCLPLSYVEESRDLETFKAVLDGLDLLLDKKECPGRCKLQVLDLRKEHVDIWTWGFPSVAEISYADILTDKPTESCGSLMTGELRLMILMDVVIKDGNQDAFQAYLLQWVRKRKERVLLCSRKLQILSGSIYKIQKALLAVHLGSIQELKVSKFWHRETMKKFAPYLGQMKNLHIFKFSKMSADFYKSRPQNLRYSRKYAPHLGQLQYLQEFHVHDVFFLYGKLPAILRNRMPLKTLSLSSCPLKESDLRFLSRCPCTRQLQHLRLRSLCMDRFRPEPLRALLRKVAGSLMTLALEDCAITDAQLLTILPALSQCSRLSFFSFWENRISMATFKSLMSHLARLGHLRLGLYPAPLECYRPQTWGLESIDPERFTQVQAGLAQALSEVRTQKAQICSQVCHRHKKCEFYSLTSNGSWVVTKEDFPGLFAPPV